MKEAPKILRRRQQEDCLRRLSESLLVLKVTSGLEGLVDFCHVQEVRGERKMGQAPEGECGVYLGLRQTKETL